LDPLRRFPQFDYPLWSTLASTLHTQFSREVSAYDSKAATAALQLEQFPDVFELMRVADEQLYFSALVRAFSRREVTPVYARLLAALTRITPISVLTTNVDETLERTLPAVECVQRTDLERLPSLISQRANFVGKLHGSVSAVMSMVFSRRDYDEIGRDTGFLTALRQVLSNSTALFLGYGLRDAHVIATLLRAAETSPLFGTGPHFIVTPTGLASDLPASVKRIQYSVDRTDHRSALLALEVVADATFKPSTVSILKPPSPTRTADSESVYFISDLVPAGKVTTSQTLRIQGEDDDISREMIVGDGYVDGEVALHDYSALHDLLGILHQLLTPPVFWSLVETKAVQLFLPPDSAAVIFPDADAPVGDLGDIQLGSESSSFGDFSGITPSERIRKQIKPLPGHEQAAERHFGQLERSLLDLSNLSPSNDIAGLTRNALMHPAIRQMLGVSAGTPRTSVPRWVVFPILRLANVMRKGVVCQHLGVRATRMIWGTELLATAVFTAAAGVEWADAAASYVLAGRFNSDLGALIAQQPALLWDVLRFRESPAGQELRSEISERLALNEGGQIVTAINSGRRRPASPSITVVCGEQGSRDRGSALAFESAALPHPTLQRSCSERCLRRSNCGVRCRSRDSR
jgi:hypothetical protein